VTSWCKILKKRGVIVTPISALKPLGESNVMWTRFQMFSVLSLLQIKTYILQLI